VLKFSDADVATVDPRPTPPAVRQQAERAIAEVKANQEDHPPIVNDKLELALQQKYPGIYHAVDRFEKMDDRQKSAVMQAGFFKYAPYAIFLLMPIFALWLKVLYLGTGKKYGEHMLFALHTNAFAFVMLGVFIFLPDGFLKFVAFCWVAGYLPWAMQRVYQKGKWGTFWRWALLGVLHGISLAIAIMGVMGLGIMSAH